MFEKPMRAKSILFALVFASSSWIVPTLSQAQAHMPDQSEIDFVIAFYNKLQPTSISQNREYCGYFGLNENEEYIATKPTKGNLGSCMPGEPPADMAVFASYHTHGAFSVEYGAEVPSTDDLRADIAEEVDGYIGTPGGRIWFDHYRDEKAYLISGRNCVVSDPNYDATSVLPVRNSYTMEQLIHRENN